MATAAPCHFVLLHGAFHGGWCWAPVADILRAAGFTSRFSIANPVGNGLPATYIACTDPFYASLESSRRAARARTDWGWREIATGHDAMVTAPRETAELLIEIAR